MTRPTALIAEDEQLLAQALRAELAQAWPELDVVSMVGDGGSAVGAALERLPDVLFLDIRMPGQDGLSAAAELADSWPLEKAPLPQLVFVTAYDEYAVRAFEQQAVDYVLKPVQAERLRKTVDRLKAALAARAPARDSASAAIEETLAQWRRMLSAAGTGALPGSPAAPPAPLKLIAASDAGSAGSTVRMVPIDEVQYFEAADKYVRVLTASHEFLIRTPLKQLLPQLDPQTFWQVHRAVVVNTHAIETVHRDEAGKLHLQLRGRAERLAVSRLFAHLFRAM
ncbi:LytTR family DNA-binding domain-containing protein [Variovorax sp. dw_954]|uniref:LytR/AlgR family response regulator transcription factor n=1 Tax=Variovorax sp. dw_954 TaxID=2720078 RepID=UPI001BD377DF|nr:LytTR family DNA-binding domain-containing protein [Variovorax sp. dw_954]